MKNLHPTYYIFYFSSLIALIVAIFFDKNFLAYAIPLVITSIGILYIKHARKLNIPYIIILLSLSLFNFLTYSDITKYIPYLLIILITYFLLSILILRKFIIDKTLILKPLLSLSFVVGAALTIYILYSYALLMFPYLKDHFVLFVTAIIVFLCYFFISYKIYISNRYTSSISLLIIALLMLFGIPLLAINELFYFDRIFTILITITQILRYYIFTIFLIKTKLKAVPTDNQTYL